MKSHHINILKNPFFLFSLFLLLLNDHVLKGIFNNALTGKISDFAGLFMFPLFILAFLPKTKKYIFPLTAVLFTLWKSELSENFIQWWNSTPLFNIGRVVDYTDLLALSILPLSSYIYSNTSHTLKVSPSFIALISLFGICATSYSDYTIPLDNTYTFQKSKETLFNQINNSDSTGIFGENIIIYDSLELSKDTTFNFSFEVSDAGTCSDYLTYETNVYGDSNTATIHVIAARHGHCGGGYFDRNKEDNTITGEAIDIFNKRIANKL